MAWSEFAPWVPAVLSVLLGSGGAVSWQPVLRIVLGLAWLFVALMGVYALLVPPVSTFEPTGLWLTVLWCMR